MYTFCIVGQKGNNSIRNMVNASDATSMSSLSNNDAAVWAVNTACNQTFRPNICRGMVADVYSVVF